jgi:hypothetical protein
MDVTKKGQVVSNVQWARSGKKLLIDEDKLVVLISELQRGRHAVRSADFYAFCDCREPHEGRPPRLAVGCGQSGMIGRPQTAKK